MIGREIAQRVLDTYGTSDLKTIVRGERLVVITLRRWKARFDDFFVRPVILIPSDITTSMRRTLIAHTLGHHFIHDGNQVWLRGYDAIWNLKLEHQAEQFAAFLTIPETEEPYLTGLPSTEIARMYKVTEDLVRVRRGSE